MAEDSLRVLIRTPHALVVDELVAGLRVTTETGLVGLRPRGEPMVFSIEAGLIVLRLLGGGERFAASAGGLLECDRETCTIYTPYAVVGDSEAQMLAAMSSMVETPNHELQMRRSLGELEQRILQELRQRPRTHGRNQLG